MHKPSMLKPSLIGGAVFGFAGALPLIGAINCACCALVVAAGFLAAYLYGNDCKGSGAAFGAGAGAKLGLMAGIFYWLVNTIVSAISRLVLPQPNMDEIRDQVMEQMESGGAPPESLDAADQIFDLLSGGGGVAILLMVSLVLSLVFATLGGIIGGAVFKNAGSPPATGTPTAPTGGV